MNKYLSKNFGLFGGKAGEVDRKVTSVLRKIFTNPINHFIVFGVLMCVIGYISGSRLFPDIIPYSVQSALASTFAFTIASIGFCLLMGYSGLASLGTGGFIGIGTYAVYYVMEMAGLPFFVALLTAIAVAIVIGVIVGFISLRIEGIYLVILTLALSEILRNLYMVVQDTVRLSLSNLVLFGMKLDRNFSIYVVTVLLVIIMMLTHNIINSPTGRAMLAMKNSTPAAQAMGISLMKYRLLAFVICTVYAALSGTMIMFTVRSATATNASGAYALITSLNILAAVIIGGYRSIWGAVFGTFVMYGMQTIFLNRIQFLQDNPVIITFISGILVILVVMFYPGGLAQLLGEVKGWIKKLARKIKEGKYGKDLG